MRISRIAPLVAAAAAMSCAAQAAAQETQAYAYDVHGRLTRVERTQGTTVRTTNYAIDDANNRTSRAIASTTSSSAVATPGVEVEAPLMTGELAETPTAPDLPLEADGEATTEAEGGPAGSDAAPAEAPPTNDDDLLPAVDAAPAYQDSND